MRTVKLFNQMSRTVFCSLLLFVSSFAKASDFVVDGIAYNAVSMDDMTCEVTFDETVNYSGSISIPSEVTYNSRIFTVVGIGYQSFKQCKEITDVKLPETIKSIGEDAFKNCTQLLSINVPESVNSIGAAAFRGCSLLETVNLPANLTVLKSDLFNNCEALKEIVIPENVESIEAGAFIYCSSLKTITIPQKCKKIGNNSFNYCTELTKATILSKDIAINGYYITGLVFPFKGCDKLTEVNLSNYISIVFFDFPILENVTFFEGTRWDDVVNDFDDTVKMKQFTILEKEPPTQTFTFSNSQYMNVMLVVPEGSLELYKSTEPWSKFWNITAYQGETGVDKITCEEVQKRNIKTVKNNKIIIKTANDSYNINGIKL